MVLSFRIALKSCNDQDDRIFSILGKMKALVQREQLKEELEGMRQRMVQHAEEMSVKMAEEREIVRTESKLERDDLNSKVYLLFLVEFCFAGIPRLLLSQFKHQQNCMKCRQTGSRTPITTRHLLTDFFPQLKELQQQLVQTQLQLDRVTRDKVVLLSEVENMKGQLTSSTADYGQVRVSMFSREKGYGLSNKLTTLLFERKDRKPQKCFAQLPVLITQQHQARLLEPLFFQATDSYKLGVTQAGLERDKAVRELARLRRELDQEETDREHVSAKKNPVKEREFQVLF